jgi:hypothetical protein
LAGISFTASCHFEQYRGKFFAKKFRRYWQIRRHRNTNKILCSKNKKRVGVQNDVMFVEQFLNFIRSFTINSYEEITKMRRIKYSTKGDQIKVEKTRFGKVNPENDVIHDAQKSNLRYKSQKNRR